MGTRLRWEQTATSSAGQVASADMWTRPDALEAPPHVHPRQGEAIRVTSGTARVRIGRNVRNMEAGEHVLIPAGAPHTFSNAGADELQVCNELTPALHWDDFCTRAWS